MPKIFDHFSGTFDHFLLFKSSGRKDNVQKPYTFPEANKMMFFAVLLHFAKYRNLCIKVSLTSMHTQLLPKHSGHRCLTITNPW